MWHKQWSRHPVWKPMKKNADGSVFIDPETHLPTTDPLGITDFFKEAPDVDEVPLVKGLSKGAASPHPHCWWSQ